MGISDQGITSVGTDLIMTTVDLITSMVDGDSELICLYYGKDTSREDAEALSDLVEEKFPECEIEVSYGGQPFYYYMVSVE